MKKAINEKKLGLRLATQTFLSNEMQRNRSLRATSYMQFMPVFLQSNAAASMSDDILSFPTRSTTMRFKDKFKFLFQYFIKRDGRKTFYRSLLYRQPICSSSLFVCFYSIFPLLSTVYSSHIKRTTLEILKFTGSPPH